MARRRRHRPWRPFQAPTRPPVGLYDPALDQGERAGNRGYQDFLADYGTNQGRGEDDYAIAQQRLQQRRAQTLQDILQNRQREQEDYGRDTQERVRQYGILGSNQNQSANAAGVLGGGYAEQAAAKRTANQGREQGQADLVHNRVLADYATNEQRVNTATDEDLASLGLAYQRGNEDSQTAVTRAGRENAAFGADTNESRWYSARSAGYVPPSAPAGQGFRVGAGGSRIYYQRTRGGATLPSGRFLNRSQLRGYLRRRGVR